MIKSTIVSSCIIALTTLAFWVPNSNANPSFSSCADCHSSFAGGSSSAGHVGHMQGLGISQCSVCHVQIGDTPPMPKCAGCHVAPGLPLHHHNSRVALCTGCHPGPSDPENTPVPGYTSITGQIDPCDGSEDTFSSFTVSLDNDGDLLYDGNDPDCQTQPLTETNCTDGIDNDSDGLFDCLDSDCSNSPSCQPSVSTEINCTDGIDNDNDGLFDCADQNCKNHHTCLSQSPSKSNLLLSYLPVLISTTVRDLSDGSDAPSNHTENEGGVLHKPGKDNPYRNGCTNCHGSNLQGGAGQSCYTCHGGVWDVSGAGNGSGLPSNHTDNEKGVLHKPGKDNPYRNGCTNCHGSILQGESASSCYACHDNEWDDNDDEDGDDD